MSDLVREINEYLADYLAGRHIGLNSPSRGASELLSASAIEIARLTAALAERDAEIARLREETARFASVMCEKMGGKHARSGVFLPRLHRNRHRLVEGEP